MVEAGVSAATEGFFFKTLVLVWGEGGVFLAQGLVFI